MVLRIEFLRLQLVRCFFRQLLAFLPDGGKLILRVLLLRFQADRFGVFGFGSIQVGALEGRIRRGDGRLVLLLQLLRKALFFRFLGRFILFQGDGR